MTTVSDAPAVDSHSLPAYKDLVVPDLVAVIIGAGFAGLAAGNRLRKKGIENFLILEKSDGVGGTWRHNTYPGIEVDIPSMAYSFSEAPNPKWSRMFAPGNELRQYAQDCTDKFGLRDKLRLNTAVRAVVFDEINDLWRVRAADADGEFEITTRFVVSCHGALSTPAVPDIPGLKSFAGKTIMSQDWDHNYSLEGKRAAVIGTGASGIQIIPAVADEVAHLTVFQRTPIYVGPKTNPAIPRAVQMALRFVPFLLRFIRFAGGLGGDVAQTVGVVHYKQFPYVTKFAGAIVRASMRARIKDPELRKKLIPSYGFACKRPSASANYLETFARPDVGLVTDSIARIVPEGIETVDGTLHRVDTLILATGFKVFDLPYRVRGIKGHDLAEFWDTNRMRAYQGVAVPEFPNYFLAPGPYGVVGFNWFDTIKMCTGHAADTIADTIIRHATRVEVSRDAFDRFFEQAVAATDNLVFKSPGCAGSHSYYINKDGDTPFLRPFAIAHSNAMMRSARTAYVQSRRYPDVDGRVIVYP
jgi:cation diffusion facilitator CzcD-associated flavoprotein CzcO